MLYLPKADPPGLKNFEHENACFVHLVTFMSYTCLLMVLCEFARINLISKANFNLIDRTELFICLPIVFQISLQTSKGQKLNFWVFGQNFCSVYNRFIYNSYN